MHARQTALECWGFSKVYTSRVTTAKARLLLVMSRRIHSPKRHVAHVPPHVRVGAVVVGAAQQLRRAGRSGGLQGTRQMGLHAGGQAAIRPHTGLLVVVCNTESPRHLTSSCHMVPIQHLDMPVPSPSPPRCCPAAPTAGRAPPEWGRRARRSGGWHTPPAAPSRHCAAEGCACRHRGRQTATCGRSMSL